LATILVSSSPDGADIYTDDAFVGNAPGNPETERRKSILLNSRWQVSRTGHADITALCWFRSASDGAPGRKPKLINGDRREVPRF